MIKQFFKDTPNSVFFWNGVVVFTIIGAFLWDIDKGYFSIVLLIIASLMLFMGSLGEGPDYNPIKNHYWVFLSPLTWAIFVLAMMIWTIVIVVVLVKKFNKFLNK